MTVTMMSFCWFNNCMNTPEDENPDKTLLSKTIIQTYHDMFTLDLLRKITGTNMLYIGNYYTQHML